MNNPIEYTETQRFVTQPVFLVVWVAFGFLIWVMNQQDLLTQAFFYVALSVVFAGILLAFISRLDTRIDEEGVHIRMTPFHRSWRHFTWDDIGSAEVVQYRPVAEYGGWGIRFRMNEIAYNVKGNKGLRFTNSNGKKYLVGTQKPEEVIEALRLLGRYNGASES